MLEALVTAPMLLVVDDDEDHLTMLEASLGDAGYRVFTATSCSEARRAIEACDIDLLVTALHLGDGTAVDLLEAVGRRRPRVAVVVSGSDREEDVDRTLEAGFDAHLVKPTSVAEICRVLDAALERRASGVRLIDPPRARVPAAPVAAVAAPRARRRRHAG